MTLFCDLHIHLGRAGGQPVKITASSRMTLKKVIEYGARVKGLHILGIIDAACSPVLEELEEMLDKKQLAECSGGGFQVPAGPLIIPGSEWEMEIEGARVHFLAFFPGLEALKEFNSYLGQKVKNPGLSTQFLSDEIHNALARPRQLGGYLALAHAFTPFKGFFGQLSSLGLLAGMAGHVDLVELGLSADAGMADQISELGTLPFIVGSDAHSPDNIGREYLEIDTDVQDMGQLFGVIQNTVGLRAFHGFPPAMGKYYRTRCRYCGFRAPGLRVKKCPGCGEKGLVQGVQDRINFLGRESGSSPVRPPYLPHLPLHVLPGFGPRTLSRLYCKLGTELEIIQQVPPDHLDQYLNSRQKALILALRRGELALESGGGGRYGRVKGPPSP